MQELFKLAWWNLHFFCVFVYVRASACVYHRSMVHHFFLQYLITQTLFVIYDFNIINVQNDDYFYLNAVLNAFNKRYAYLLKYLVNVFFTGISNTTIYNCFKSSIVVGIFWKTLPLTYPHKISMLQHTFINRNKLNCAIFT